MRENKPLFKLESIITVESSFKREESIQDEEYRSSETIIELSNHAREMSENIFQIFVTLILTQQTPKRKLVEIKVVTRGTFSVSNDSIGEEILRDFANINAPAILFPFLREAVASYSLKAGLPPILIQPINFVALNQKEKPQK